MRAPVDDLLGAAPRRQAVQAGYALLGDDDVDVVLRVVDMADHGHDVGDRPALDGRRREEHTLRHLDIIIAAYQVFLDKVRDEMT